MQSVIPVQSLHLLGTRSSCCSAESRSASKASSVVCKVLVHLTPVSEKQFTSKQNMAGKLDGLS